MIEQRHMRYAAISGLDRANCPISTCLLDDAIQEAWVAALTALKAGKSREFAITRARWAVFDWIVQIYRENDAAYALARVRGDFVARVDKSEIFDRFAGRGKYGRVICLALEGATVFEIADRLGISQAAVRSYISRGRRELRKENTMV